MDKKLKEWLDGKEGDEYCAYCKYQDICGGGVSGSPNGPVYPPCSDGEFTDFIDLAAAEKAMREEEEEEAEYGE